MAVTILSVITIALSACSAAFSIRTRRLLRQAARDLAAIPSPLIRMPGTLTPEAEAELRRRFHEKMRHHHGAPQPPE